MRISGGLALLVAVATLVVPAHADWETVILTNNTNSAACLDGTPPGFHIWAEGADPERWMLHFQGGGWCINEEDCLARSQTDMGSSKNFASTMDSILASFDGGAHGFFSSDPAQNPEFFNYTKVYIRYCDGASYSGNVAQPVVVQNTPLHFKGKQNLDAYLAEFMRRGLGNAKTLLVNGCSAGGLAVYLHLDYIRARVPSSVVVKGIPECGFFMDVPNYANTSSYTDNYKYVFRMQNVSASVNAGCLKNYPPEEQWKCFMAQYTVPFITTPYFIINSFYDAWQMSNILQLPCANNISACTPAEIAAFNAFRSEMLTALAPAFNNKQSNVYSYACVTHCGWFCHDGLWEELTVQKATLRDAFTAWALGSSGKQNFVDCEGYQCNPTCLGT